MTSIEINGKTYEVKVKFIALKHLAKELGCRFDEITEKAQDAFNYPLILKYGINTVTGQNITTDEIEAWLDGGDFTRLTAISKVIADEILTYFVTANNEAKEKNV